MRAFNVLDLFSGIGGFSLGLERAGGFKTRAFCEIDPYCRRVLAKHWPEVPQYDDIRTLTAERLKDDGIAIDAICGGFPCQDISTAGKGAGLGGERSGLWREYARLIGELRPDYAIIENVSALLGRGLDRVLCDLAALRYDAEWHCIPASAIGAPHQRDRIWIIAHSRGEQHQGNSAAFGWALAAELSKSYPDTNGHDEYGRPGYVQMGRRWSQGADETDIHAAGNQWAFEPAMGRMAYGVPDRLDRLTALGNAVVPQIPELIGRAILSTHTEAA